MSEHRNPQAPVIARTNNCPGNACSGESYGAQFANFDAKQRPPKATAIRSMWINDR